MPDPLDPDDPAATAATAAAIAHLQACAAADEALDEGWAVDGDDPVHPATGLWDGCSDCVAREALAAALPAYRAALLERVLDYLRDVGKVDALTVADWLERDLPPVPPAVCTPAEQSTRTEEPRRP